MEIEIKMGKKILLVDHYSKLGKESLPALLAELGFIVDKVFKSDFEELKGLLIRGKYHFLFINLESMKSHAVEMVERLRQEFNELPIIGLLVTENDSRNHNGFTKILKHPVDFKELKRILGPVTSSPEQYSHE